MRPANTPVTTRNHLEFYRRLRGLNYHTASQQFGVKWETYKRIELNEKSPSLEQAYAMADFFGLALNELFFREGENPPLRLVEHHP